MNAEGIQIWWRTPFFNTCAQLWQRRLVSVLSGPENFYGFVLLDNSTNLTAGRHCLNARQRRRSPRFGLPQIPQFMCLTFGNWICVQSCRVGPSCGCSPRFKPCLQYVQISIMHVLQLFLQSYHAHACSMNQPSAKRAAANCSTNHMPIMHFVKGKFSL